MLSASLNKTHPSFHSDVYITGLHVGQKLEVFDLTVHVWTSAVYSSAYKSAGQYRESIHVNVLLLLNPDDRQWPPVNLFGGVRQIAPQNQKDIECKTDN